MKRTHLRLLSMISFRMFLCLIVMSFGIVSWADEATDDMKTRTELLNELNLRMAQVVEDNAQEVYERYKSEYENVKVLFDQNIISKKEMDQAYSDYMRAKQQLREAEISLEKTKLSFLENATHITVVDAKKYYNGDGKRMLDLVLKNSSSMSQAQSAINELDPNQLQALLDIENIIVSIKNGASIGKPYEQIIPLLPYGEETKLSYVLLTDATEAIISMRYLNETVEQKVYLEKESLQKVPTVIAAQFSQEGELNSDIYYDIDLEMFVTTDQGFSLIVTNLPPQIKYSFIDKKTNAKITQVRFTEEISAQSLRLSLSIPKNLGLDMIDEDINFQVWALRGTQLETINKLQHSGEGIDVEQLNKIEAGRVDLIVIPKGTGKLEIVINNLLEEIKPGEELSLDIQLSNIGTLPLFNVTPEIFPPLGWDAELSQDVIEKLLPDDKKSVTINLKPKPNVSAGEYEAQIKSKGQSGSEIIESLEKRLHIRVLNKSNIILTLILVSTLLLLVCGVVYAGVKMSRR